MALTKVSTPAIKDEAITLAKLLHGDSNNNGKFLRANNGADPSFETITGTTINNNADNRVITGSGTANTLNGEANFTFNSKVILSHAATTTISDRGFQANASSDLTDGQYLPALGLNPNAGNTDRTRAGIAGVSHNGTAGMHLAFLTRHAADGTQLNSSDEKMRLDTSGRLGIGTTSPQVTGIHINGSSARLQLTDSTTGTGSGDGVIFGLNGDQDFFINNRESSKNLIFFTANSEVLRIDSSGRVGIGLTPVNRILHTSSASSASRIQIDNTTNSNGLQIGADGNGSFQSTLSANDHLIYTNGGLRARWTANGLCFNGDSAAANALDDYEEGTWTPVYNNLENAPTYGHRSGRYTKIGRFVYIVCQLSVDSGLDNSDGSGINIGGFPFTGNNAHSSALFTFGRYNTIMSDSVLSSFTNVRFNGDGVMLQKGSNGSNNISYSQCNTSGHLQFAMSYAL